MARVTAPLLAFSARGQIGKSIVYAVWKGRAYARQLVIPANPRSTAQTENRTLFNFLNQTYKYFPSGAKLAWQMFARGQQMTELNAFVHINQPLLNGETTLDNFIFSTSAGSGLPAQGITITPGSGSLTIVVSAPTVPVDWTITRAFAAVIRQQDPHVGTLYQVKSAEDASSPYSMSITGLTSGQAYVCGGWFEYEKADGSFAYGQSIQGTGTPS